jgi:predicted DNA-binding transcriptional regulator YafY
MTGMPFLFGEPLVFDIPQVNIQELVAADTEATTRTQATIALAPGAAARIRRAAHRSNYAPGQTEKIPHDWDIVDVDVLDESELVAQLAALGPSARVLEPTRLIALVSDHLRAVRDAHLAHSNTMRRPSTRTGES